MSAPVAFAALFVLLTATPAAASARDQYIAIRSLSECATERFYDAKSTDVPAPIAATLSGSASFLVFSTCTDSDKNLHYFIRVSRRNPGGVCRVFKDELFLSTKTDDPVDVGKPLDANKPVDLNAVDTNPFVTLTGWTDRMPEAWRHAGYQRQTTSLAMLVEPAATACPAVTDPRYIPMNATDGMFKGFMRLWRDATASRPAFDRIFGPVYVSDAEVIPDLNPEDVRDTLRRLIFNDHEGITRIDCERGSAYGTGCNALFGGYWIQFDVGESGRLEILSVRDDTEDGPL